MPIPAVRWCGACLSVSTTRPATWLWVREAWVAYLCDDCCADWLVDLATDVAMADAAAWRGDLL